MYHKESTLIRWTQTANSRKRINEKEITKAVEELLPDFRYVPKKDANDKHRIIDKNGTINDPLFEETNNQRLLLSVLDWITPNSSILPESKSKIDYFKQEKNKTEEEINKKMKELNSKIGDEFDTCIIYKNGKYHICLI